MNTEMFVRVSSDALRWIAEPALRTIVLAGIAALALWAFRVRSASAQLAAWTAVLCAALALPLLSWLLPPMFMRLPVWPSHPYVQAAVVQPGARVEHIATEPVADARPPIRTRQAAETTTTTTLGTAKEAGTLPVAKPDAFAWPLLAFAAYLLVLAVLAGRLCVGWILTRRMRRSAIPVHDSKPLQRIGSCIRQIELRKAPLLLESRAANVPLTFGALRPAIVIPQSWRGWEEAKLAAVISHELSHVQRRDPLVRLLAAIYRSVFWFSPLSWWLEHRLADLGEQVSDQAAITAGAEPTYYAEVLMSFFRTIHSGHGRVNWQGAQMADGGRAANRIERVLSLKTLRPAGWSRSLITAAITGALPLVLLIAAARPKFVLASAAAPPQAAAAQTSPISPPAPAAPAAPPAPTPIGGTGNLGGTIAGTVTPRAVPQAPRLLEAVPLMPISTDQDVTYPYRSNGFNGGMDFAIFSGDLVIVSGSDDDRNAAERLHKKTSGDFIWFIHERSEYVIRDAATVQAAKQLYSPMEDLRKQQEALEKQQEELENQQEEMGKQMEAVRVEVPADLVQRMQAVEAKIKALGGSADMDQLGRLQGEFGDLQYQLGSLQHKAGEAQRELGEQQRLLGEKQRDLARGQRDLGRKQAESAREAPRRMQEIIGKALADGTAKRVE